MVESGSTRHHKETEVILKTLRLRTNRRSSSQNNKRFSFTECLTLTPISNTSSRTTRRIRIRTHHMRTSIQILRSTPSCTPSRSLRKRVRRKPASLSLPTSHNKFPTQQTPETVASSRSSFPRRLVRLMASKTITKSSPPPINTL